MPTVTSLVMADQGALMNQTNSPLEYLAAFAIAFAAGALSSIALAAYVRRLATGLK